MATHRAASSAGPPEPLEPLAIVGFSFRFPGDAVTPEAFWRVLEERTCLMTEWPADRIRMDAFHQPRSTQRHQKTAVAGAHLLRDDLGLFDAPFFGISATEAMAIDPVSRITLETTYHALESAGIPMERVKGSSTGVYSGSMNEDYKQLVVRDGHDIPRYSATGTSANMIPNRISWFYDFLGPSVHIDSACSSSLMAFDLACSGLRNRDVDMAVVTGAGMSLAAENVLALVNMGFLSPDGRCYSFDHRANGYARGEGVSVVLIKRLTDAIRDGNTIRAVVRSSGSNQDGHTPGLTQPSGKAQAQLIRETYSKAGLSLDETRFFEAHGTGTALGDPIEAEAIGNTFRESRSPVDPLYIGALKSNIGHLEGGSGLAAVIKLIMVLERGVIPPNANFEQVNPGIDEEFLNIKFPLQCVPWPTSGLRRASVASFGFGGSNAHAILDDAYNFLKTRHLSALHRTVESPPIVRTLSTPQQLTNGTPHDHSQMNGINGAGESSPTKPEFVSHVDHTSEDEHSELAPLTNGDLRQYVNGDSRPLVNGATPVTPVLGRQPRLIVLSAGDEDGVKRMADVYEGHFSDLSSHDRQDPKLLDHLAYTLASHRSVLPWRSFALLDQPDDLMSLSRFISQPSRTEGPQGLAMVFTGQGAQYIGMGASLLCHRVFRRVIQEFDRVLADLGAPFASANLLRDCGNSAGINIDDPAYSQPLTTALEIALFELLSSCGLHPAAVVGHSSGEIAAAYASGALSLASACRVSYFRGRLASRLIENGSHPGAMLAVSLSRDRMQAVISKDHSGHGLICIACVNSPDSVTVSGDLWQIDALESRLAGEGIFARKLNTGVAYHSPHMAVIATEYANLLSDLELGVPVKDRPTLVSSVTGMHVQHPSDVCSAHYWVSNLISPVLFKDAMETLLASTASGQNRKLGSPKPIIIHDILEVGPHATLRRPVIDTLAFAGVKERIQYSSILNRNQPAGTTFLQNAGQLFARGYAVDIAAANFKSDFFEGARSLTLELPAYPFNHSKSYWHEAPISRNFRQRAFAKHELLGTPVSDWNPLEARWRKFFDVTETPWLADHKVNGKIVYPAMGMVVMAIEAAKQLADPNRTTSGYELYEAKFSSPITIDAASRTEAQLCMRHDHTRSNKHQTSYDFRIYSRNDKEWVLNCRGVLQTQYETDAVGYLTADLERETQSFRKECEEIAASCALQVPAEKMYAKFEDNGLSYGPSFRALDRLAWDGTCSSIGRLNCFQWSDEQSTNTRQQHVAHPTTLDAAGQLVWVHITKGATETIFQGFAVTRIKHAWFSSLGLSYPGTPYLQSFCTGGLKGLRGAETSVLAMDPAGNLRLMISQLEVTAVGGSAANLAGEIPRQLCFDMRWKPDPDLLDAEALTSYTGQSPVEAASPKNFARDLTCVQLYFVNRALETKNEWFSKDVEPHLMKYLSWLELQMKRFHLNEISRPYSMHEVDLSVQDTITELIRRVGDSSAEGEASVQIGRILPFILSGIVDPSKILAQSKFADNYYDEIWEQMACRPQFKAYLELEAHKHPGLQVLEIGAGIGSTTSHVLDALLPDDDSSGGDNTLSRYDYTDISDSFFVEASKRFEHAKPRMNFQVLDIERDPSEQRLKPGSYDIVLAAWALHNTRDLAVALKNVKGLLKPGGKLIIIEATAPTALKTGFIFGALPSWWAHEGKDRQWSPCISEPQWDSILKSSGLSGVDISLLGPNDASYHGHSIMISTAELPVTITTELQTEGRQCVIWFDPSSHLQISLKDNLSECFMQDFGLACLAVSKNDEFPGSIKRSTTLVNLMELDKPYLRYLDEAHFAALQKTLSTVESVLWVSGSANPESKHYVNTSLAKGLGRVLCSERPDLAFITLALEDHASQPEEWLRRIREVLHVSLWGSRECRELEYVEQNGTLMINRVFASPKMDLELHRRNHAVSKQQEWTRGPPLALAIPHPGLLNTMHFEEDRSFHDDLRPNEIEIKVHAIGINFRDLLVTLGRFPDTSVGCECAGVVTRIGTACSGLEIGQRVCAMAFGCARTFARFDSQLAVAINDDMSFSEAASVPVTGATAYYALIQIADLQPGESILIHSAAGGTGQMAVQVAQSVGAEVYVTVGTEEKKQLMKDSYGIPDDHIFASRDTSFARGIMRATRGKGVDVILNSLSGPALTASWEVIAPFGRFLELGKADIESNSNLPMASFAKNVSFTAIALDHMAAHRPRQVSKALAAVMRMLSQGKISHAHPLLEYPISELERAFRVMQGGKNTGKMVITMQEGDMVNAHLRYKTGYSLDSSATYLIAGGLGGLGRSAAQWLAQRGAKNLILLSRSGPRSPASHTLLTMLASLGVTVETPICDVSSETSLTAALSQCSHLPPIKGCIQGTMALHDAPFETMAWAQWSRSLSSKVATSANLDALLPHDLDFFLTLSSVTAIAGSPGQANYAAGNAFQDALAAHRRARGLRAVSLNLGLMADVGAVADDAALARTLASSAAHLIPVFEADFHALLDHYCDPHLPLTVDGPTVLQPILGLTTSARENTSPAPAYLLDRPLLRPLFVGSQSTHSGSAKGAAASMSTAESELAAQFSRAGSAPERVAVVAEALLAKLSRALGIPAGEIDRRRPLHACGVDSLVAVELRNWFAKALRADVAVFDITGQNTLDSLAEAAAGKSALGGKGEGEGERG